MAKLAMFVALSEEMGYAIEEMRKFGRFVGPDPEAQMRNGQTKFQFEMKKFPQRENRIEVHLIRGMGNVLSAAHVGTAFGSEDSVRFALLVGISGSLDENEAGLADVIVSNSVKYYSPDKLYNFSSGDRKVVPITRDLRDAVIERGVPLESVVSLSADAEIAVDDRDFVYGDNLLRFLRDQVYHEDPDNIGHLFVDELSNNNNCSYKIRSGTILGTNWVIDSATYVDYLKQKNDWVNFDYYFMNSKDEYNSRCKWDSEKIVAVDMESYGFMTAISTFSKRFTNVKAYSVRGISDLCAGKSSFDLKRKNENRMLAAKNGVNAALRLFQYRVALQYPSVEV